MICRYEIDDEFVCMLPPVASLVSQNNQNILDQVH